MDIRPGYASCDGCGTVYPADLPARRWLAYYAESFDTVEVNNSFYRLPPEDTFRGWAGQVPQLVPVPRRSIDRLNPRMSPDCGVIPRGSGPQHS